MVHPAQPIFSTFDQQTHRRHFSKTHKHHCHSSLPHHSLSLLLFSLFLVVSIPSHSEQIQVESLSLKQYESLRSDTLFSCTEHSISYRTFLASSASFGQVCLNGFVFHGCISTLYFAEDHSSFQNDDFRSIGFSFFQTLSMLCRVSRRQLSDILASLYSQSLLSLNLLSRANFEVQSLK